MSEAKHKIEPTNDVKEGHIDDFPEFEPADAATCLKRRDRLKHALSQFDNSMQVIDTDICKSVQNDESCLERLKDAVLAALNNLTHANVGLMASIGLQDDLLEEFDKRSKTANDILKQIDDHFKSPNVCSRCR